MLDVYPAREQPVGELAGVSGLAVARAAADHAGGRPVVAARRRHGPRASSRRGFGEGDLLVTIGAGDVFQLADAARWRAMAGERRPTASSATTRWPG